MAEYVTVSIPEALVHRARKLARVRRRPVDTVIAELLDEALPPAEEAAIPSEADEAAITREMEAYVALHPSLKANYLGQYVAILDGQLVDHDGDPSALYQRIVARYGDRFVWLTAVEEEALTTLVFRSPRIVPQP